jgi:hypothetical protein
LGSRPVDSFDFGFWFPIYVIVLRV